MITLLLIQQGIQLCHPSPNSTIYPQYFPCRVCYLKLREDQGQVLTRTPSQKLGPHWDWKGLKAKSPSITTAEVLGSNCQSDPPDTIGFNLILCLFSPLGADKTGNTPDTASPSWGWGGSHSRAFLAPGSSGHHTAPPGQEPQHRAQTPHSCYLKAIVFKETIMQYTLNSYSSVSIISP